MSQVMAEKYLWLNKYGVTSILTSSNLIDNILLNLSPGKPLNKNHAQATHKSTVSNWLSSKLGHWPRLEKALIFCKAMAAKPIALELCANFLCIGGAALVCMQGLACWSYLSIRAFTAFNIIYALGSLVRGYPTRIYIKSGFQKARRLCKERFRRYMKEHPTSSSELNPNQIRRERRILMESCSSSRKRLCSSPRKYPSC